MKFYLVNFHYPDSYSDVIRSRPQGSGYVLEAVEQAGIPARYWEYSLNPKIEDLISDIRSFSPSLIGCSFFSHHYQTTYDVIDKLAGLKIPIVCGGVHVNTMGSQLLDAIKATFLIKGEGEESVVQLLKNLSAPETYPQIPGLVYRADGKIQENQRELLDLSNVSFPRFSQFRQDVYEQDRRVILSSRGCPYSCTFCTMSALLSKKWRGRKPEDILSELEYWAVRGITRFDFADDNLTLDADRMKKLCRLIQKSPYQYHLGAAGVRISNVDYDMLKLMRDSGFRQLSFGIESGNDRVLKEIKKGLTVKQAHRALGMVCRLGYDVKLYFIVNNRTETLNEARDSFHLARQYPIQVARFSNLVPYPGSSDYDWIRKHGRLLYDPEDYLGRLDEFRHQPLYDGPGMTLAERRQVIREAKQEIKRFEPGLSQRARKAIQILRRGEVANLLQIGMRKLLRIRNN